MSEKMTGDVGKAINGLMGRIAAMEAREDALVCEVARLRAVAREAIDEIEAWAAYASDFFKERHDLAGTLASLRARALSEGDA